MHVDLQYNSVTVNISIAPIAGLSTTYFTGLNLKDRVTGQCKKQCWHEVIGEYSQSSCRTNGRRDTSAVHTQRCNS